MNRKPLIAAFFTVGLLSLGCLGTEEDPELLAEAQEPIGFGGFMGDNHYSPSEFQANTLTVRNALAVRLKGTSIFFPNEVSSGVVNTGIFNTSSGKNMFEEAVNCGIGARDYVTHSNDPHGNYYGGGYMLTTTGWDTTGLTQSQREDLFTCMITRLNPSGQHVTIVLGGQNVTATGSDTSDFTYVEAVWSTTESINPFTGSPQLTFKVWPSPDLLGACGNNISLLQQQLTGRTCPSPNSSCGLVVETDTSTFPKGCTGSDMNWTCNNKPAIETRLRQIDMPYLYPKCAF